MVIFVVYMVFLKKKKSLLNHCYCGKTNINFVLYHGFTTKIII